MELPAFSKEKNMYTLQLASTPESINILETFIDNLKVTYEISEESYANILIAMTEAANNAIMHGNKQNEQKKVYINLEIEFGKKLIFTVADEGDGFNFQNVADPTLPENLERQSGRGVFIMKNLCDQFIYNKKGNEIELHFKI